MVGPEGMEKFCEDIGVEPENVSSFLFDLFICNLYGIHYYSIHELTFDDPCNIGLVLTSLYIQKYLFELLLFLSREMRVLIFCVLLNLDHL